MDRFAPHLLALRWEDGLFAHWSFDPDAVRTVLPAPLTLDARDGRAWVGALAFRNADQRPRGLPPALGVTAPEINLRTYVRLDGEPGVYFFSLDVDGAVLAAVAGLFTGLPYRRARIRMRVEEGTVSVHSERADGAASFGATYRPSGDEFRPPPGSLARWLVERRRLFVPRGDAVRYATVAHEPWPLRPATATVRAGELFAAAGLPSPASDPVLHYCDRLPMLASVVRRLERGAGDPGRR